MWLTLMCVVSLPADTNLINLDLQIIRFYFKLRACVCDSKNKRQLHFTTFITNVRRSFIFRLMRNIVGNQCTAIAKSSRTLRTGKRSLGFGPMILYMILKYFWACEHFLAFIACECAGLQVFGHMQCEGFWLYELHFTACHVALHLMAIGVMLAEIRKFVEQWPLQLISINMEL